jgi:hypothetical protein
MDSSFPFHLEFSSHELNSSFCLQPHVFPLLLRKADEGCSVLTFGPIEDTAGTAYSKLRAAPQEPRFYAFGLCGATGKTSGACRLLNAGGDSGRSFRIAGRLL